MQEPTLRAEVPHWRTSLRRESYAYGLVLLLTLCSLIFQLAAPDEEWARVITVVLQSLTLLAALHVSGAHRWVVRATALIAGVAVLGALVVSVGSGEVGEAAGRTLGLLLVILAPFTIVRGLVRHARDTGAITLQTMFGVLCVYLLVGMAFAFAFGIIATVSNEQFFNQVPVDGGTQSDFLYFSFTTLTTTGFGDLTPAYDLGRSLTIAEALIGQIYLVTVVALIVGNIGASVRRAAR
jgi:hypothetical protein